MNLKIGTNCYISKDANIGKNVTIGNNCIITGNVTIGDNTEIKRRGYDKIFHQNVLQADKGADFDFLRPAK